MRMRTCSASSDQLQFIRNLSRKSSTVSPRRGQCRLLISRAFSRPWESRHLSTTTCAWEDARQHNPNLSRSANATLERPSDDKVAMDKSDERDIELVIRRMDRSMQKGREQGRLQSVEEIQEQSRSKAYSIPDPKLYRGSTSTDVRSSRRTPSFEDLRTPKFYASQATAPLLLTFDAFGTLYTPRCPVADQYCDVAAQFGYTASPKDVETAFKRELKNMLELYPHYGKTSGVSVESWWKGLITRVFTPLLPAAAVIDPRFLSALYVRFATSEGYSLFPDVPPLLQTIGASFSASSWSPKRTIVGVVSNSDPRVRSVLSTLNVMLQPGLFPPRLAPVHPRDNPSFGPASVSFEALSYELDVEKPDPRIFDHALRLAQDALSQHAPVAQMTRSGKYLLSSIQKEFWHCHVGDSVEKDVLPAIKAGWDAILLDRGAPEPVASRFAGGQEYTVINSLNVLASVLTPKRANDAMARGRRVREQRRASGAGHALGFKEEVESQGKLGFKASQIRTPESTKYLGTGPFADEYRQVRQQMRRAAIARSRSNNSV